MLELALDNQFREITARTLKGPLLREWAVILLSLWCYSCENSPAALSVPNTVRCVTQVCSPKQICMPRVFPLHGWIFLSAFLHLLSKQTGQLPYSCWYFMHSIVSLPNLISRCGRWKQEGQALNPTHSYVKSTGLSQHCTQQINFTKKQMKKSGITVKESRWGISWRSFCAASLSVVWCFSL